MKINVIIEKEKNDQGKYVLKIQNRKYKINFKTVLDRHNLIELNIPEPTAITPKHKLTFDDWHDLLQIFPASIYVSHLLKEIFVYLVRELPKYWESVK